MPNKNYLRGVRFERELKHQYEDANCIVYRTAGSHGNYDLISFNYKTKVINLLQCKTKVVNKKTKILPLYQELENSNGWIVQGHKVTKEVRNAKS